MTVKPLQEIADIIMGQSPPSSTYNQEKIGLPFFQGNKDFGAMYPTPTVYCSDPVRIAKKGDVLVSVRAPVGDINLAPNEDSCIGRGLAALRPKNNTSTLYLFYFIKSIQYWLSREGAGTTFSAINKDTLSNLEVPFIDLVEQEKVIKNVASLVSILNQINDELLLTKQKARTFRNSILAAAFTGKLTEEWRAKSSKDNSYYSVELHAGDKIQIPVNWKYTTLESVIEKIEAGKNFACPEIPVQDNTVGLVKISSVTWGEFNEKETKTVIDETKIDPKLFIKTGDFLISRANTAELVGASVIVKKINHRIMISDKVWRVHFNNISKEYVNYYLKSSLGRSEMEFLATGNQQSMRNISQKKFASINIPVPLDEEEQIEIIKRINNYLNIASQIESQIQVAQEEVSRLTQATLSKTFRSV